MEDQQSEVKALVPLSYLTANTVSIREHLELAKRVEVMQAVIDAHEKTMSLAREEMNRRLEGMNKFREEIEEDKQEFVTHQEYKILDGKVDSINRFVWIGTAIIMTFAALTGLLFHYIFPVKTP